MDERQRRIARARLLRREGKTYNEIRAALEIGVGDDVLASWLRGIPRPYETYRGRANDELRAECRRLRTEGLTYNEIAERTGASKGSISPWVRDIRMSDQARQRITDKEQASRQGGGQRSHERALARHEAIRQRAAELIADVDARDLFIAGVAIYWSEGSKDKAWRRNGRVTLINSDPTILRIFVRPRDHQAAQPDDDSQKLRWWLPRLSRGERRAIGRALLLDRRVVALARERRSGAADEAH